MGGTDPDAGGRGLFAFMGIEVFEIRERIFKRSGEGGGRDRKPSHTPTSSVFAWKVTFHCRSEIESFQCVGLSALKASISPSRVVHVFTCHISEQGSLVPHYVHVLMRDLGRLEFRHFEICFMLFSNIFHFHMTSSFVQLRQF